MKLGIIGLGLIGGSLAKVFKASLEDVTIEACDRDKASLEQAIQLGVIDTGVGSVQDLSQHLDYVFVCTPISTVVDVMKTVIAHVSATTVVTDVASVKSTLSREVVGPNVVPGHPIAGTEFSGFSASDAGMMKGATYVLVPSKENAGAVLKLSALLETCDFNVEVLSAEEHDAHLAATSHIPYFLAVALRDHVESKGVPDCLRGTGYKSATRVSGMPAAWGEDVLRENRDAITSQLTEIIARLNQL